MLEAQATRIGFEGRRKVYGDRLALLAQLHLAYADGRVEVVGSDTRWRAARGPILMSDIYMGETYDARKEIPGWRRPGFDDSGWAAARVVGAPAGVLRAESQAVVRT